MRKIKFNIWAGILLFSIAVAAVVVVGINRENSSDNGIKSEPTAVIEETTPTEYIETTAAIEETTVATDPTIPETEPIVLPTEPEETVTTPAVDTTLMCDTNSELEMLACTIYQEAGGDGSCDLCRYRVADVVLNRIDTGYWGDSMYDVLTANRQYGRFYLTGIKWSDRAKSPSEAAAVSRAYAVAEDVLNGNHSELYGAGYIWQAEFVQGNAGFWCCGHYYGKN